VIVQAVWLYLRLLLSLWMVEDLLAKRGIIVSQQTVRLRARNSITALPAKFADDPLVSSAKNGSSMTSPSPSEARNTD
jgi:hypothetical protein